MSTSMPTHLRRPLRELLAAGGSVARDANQVMIAGPPVLASALQDGVDELAGYVVPSIDAEQAALVRALLTDAGATVAYVTTPAIARQAVANIIAGAPDVVGIDFETEVEPEYRQPIPIKFRKDGNLAARQPRDGAAGAAIDPFRSKVRTVQAWAGGEHVYVFDMRKVAWADIAPLFTLPLAIFNAVFETKRLIHEAGIEPTGRINDVMTAMRLTDGRRPSLGEAVAINYKLTLPKELGASDWSADTLTIEQLEYAALDAVLCVMLWHTQQHELFDDMDRQCQELVDAVTPAIARMELAGMPIDVAAHRAQILRWQTELATAEKALREASPLRNLLKRAELQAHLREVLDVEALAEWPRTDTDLLVTKRQQLQLNDHIPALTELLQVSALQKLLDAFGESLIEAINPITGRLHTSFLIAGASSGRFSARNVNLQQMPKQREAGFRKIFAAPSGQVVMALDYSQIELRVVGELISDWFGTDSILRQAFAAGLDAHTATAMSMTGKNRPEDVTADERQLAKPCNFGLLYLMGNAGFHRYLRTNFPQTADVSFEQACELRTRFFDCYPDLARWQAEYARHTRKQGYTQTVAGRRWYWKWMAKNPDDVDEDSPFYQDAITGFHGVNAINHPVQGSSAEVMQIALTRLDQVLRNEPVQIIATVHDEVVLLVPDDAVTVERIGSIAQREMIAAFTEVFPEAPTLNLVEPKVGPTWGDLQPLKDFIETRRGSLCEPVQAAE
jgi:DNA polymerase I-like protein with 3'-5' exonuclease and polymerase domains